MNRLEFIYGLLASPYAVAADGRPSPGNMPEGRRHPLKQASDAQECGKPNISSMLYGPLRPETDLDAWFQSISTWGVQKWMAYAFPYHPRYEKGSPSVYAFLGDLLPEFTPYLDPKLLHVQEDLLLRQAELCGNHGIDFWYLLPFPIFPVPDRAEIQKAIPSLFSSGKMDLSSPLLPKLLKTEIRALKKAMPSLKGVNIWFAEGAGEAVTLSRQDLARSGEWQKPIVKAFDEITHELQIEGIVFAHNYLLTVGMRRDIYRMMAEFPGLDIMEDITWPEEDMQHPFLGYLPQSDRELLFEVNPVDLSFLIDTEYTGQGVLPSVYPRWWKHNLCEAVHSGARIAMGRTFFWDGGCTDINFNRLNAYIFTRLCREPELDPRQLLGAAAREMFGEKIDSQLVDILWETEPILKEIIGIHGIDCLDHSSFPEPEEIDVLYMEEHAAMKGIDDLFQPPGTILYPKLTDDLINFKQWRWQDQTVSLPAETYIAVKKRAVAWTKRTVPEVIRLSASLPTQHRDLFVHGYRLMAILAQGMELFVETTSIHYQWAHAKTMNDKDARIKFRSLAGQFRALAATVPENPFSYRERMTECADFLENNLPRLSKVGS